ncbi:MAG TPA: nucleoside hydrolase [Candidatus Acidoferrum sp.]|nr:nucleoside hydrolase [Candidatus Acidoferrum sp.]
MLTRFHSAPDSSRGLSTIALITSLTLELAARRVTRLAAQVLLGVALLALPLCAQSKRKVIIDQDAAGPGGTDMQAILALINSPETDVLGITVLTGDAWRDEEVQHTLRLLEIIGRIDIPVLPGAAFPLVSSKEYIARWETLYGKVVYQGAWNFAKGHAVHGPYEIPPLPEGAPSIKASNEDAAHFMVRMVHQFPHEVTIYAAGPMTDLALAIALDAHFPELVKELIVMGGSINPMSDDPEFHLSPRREFNFWMDPEASHAVLHAHWPRFVLTTVDISIKTRMEKNLIAQVAKSNTPAAQYVAKYAEANYLWDELAAAAWLDPTIITKWQKLYMDVEVDHGASYGDTLAWAPGQQPGMGESLVEVQDDLDKEKFYKEYVDLLTRPTPQAHAGNGNKPPIR